MNYYFLTLGRPRENFKIIIIIIILLLLLLLSCCCCLLLLLNYGAKKAYFGYMALANISFLAKFSRTHEKERATE